MMSQGWIERVDSAPQIDVSQAPALSRRMLNSMMLPSAPIAGGRQQVLNTTAFPASSIAQLIMTLADGQTLAGATGVFIAENVVLTAAHAVFVPGFGPLAGLIQKMVIVPGRDGSSTPFGAATTTSFYVPPVWLSHQLPDFDYALAFVPRLAVPLFVVVAVNDSQLTNLPVTVAGYPLDVPVGTQWTEDGQIAAVSPGQVAYNINTSVGQSGAAVAHHTNQRAFVVAVHRFEDDRASFGTRITPSVRDDILAHIA